MSAMDYTIGPFDPRLPDAPINLGKRTRLALEIAENDNGEIEFAEFDPETGERVEEAA
jgi:hypothetical protein